MVFILDLIPLLAFFYFFQQYNVFAGAAALLIATIIVNIIHFIRQKGKLNKQQLVVLILTVVFCGLTLIFHNKVFVQIKSTIINMVFALAILVSIFMDKPLTQTLMKDVFVLSKSGWNKLAYAWMGFFIVMAGLHWYFAFYTSEATWRAFKVWGGMPIMLAFIIGQFIVLRKNLNPEIQQKK